MKQINFLIAVFLNCTVLATAQQTQKLTDYVNPIIGTNKMGHTFPGATVPFGAVQLSPETNQMMMFENGAYNAETYRYCAGYQYADTTIFGFSHTHFSGTGHSDLGDFLIMPISGKRTLIPGNLSKGEVGYYSTFSHDSEKASPNYYSVKLDKYGIKAELTTSTRVGFHQYTFDKKQNQSILLDLIANIYNYEGKNVWSEIRVENDTLITGYRQTNGWARNKTIYFAMVLSEPIQNYGYEKLEKPAYNGFWRRFEEDKNFPEMAGKDIRAWFEFGEVEQLKIKFSMSSVSTKGALLNLTQEVPQWDFDLVRKKGVQQWETELGKIQSTHLTESDKTTFYTAFYHTLLGPITYMDVDGQYRGLDKNIYKNTTHTNYTIFSLWDTYRALHPWFNLIQPKRNSEMVRSMLAHYEQSVHGMLPIWSHYGNENWCMIGYHAVSVLADAMAKNNDNFDTSLALQAAIETSNYTRFDGLGYYTTLGYIPEDKNSNSVSKTLEFAYDDWCIAQIARISGNKEREKEYLNRSQFFNNVFNQESGFMHPKLSNGNWRANFDPLSTHGQGFIEGNSWNYSFFVPHDIPKLIVLIGGDKAFTERLDKLFNMHLEDAYFAHTEDITRDGLMGNYVHGNEPGHHIPYLYNWTSAPWKTQSRVRKIMDEMYNDSINGLCGNDDAGQMSAWYTFSALGFYPVVPGSDWYAIGSPKVVSANLTFENGKTLAIQVKKQSKTNQYIQKLTLNGKEIKANFLTHQQITNGGVLEFTMGKKPNKKWGIIAPNG